MRRGAVGIAIALVLAACTADDPLPAGTPHDPTAVFHPAPMVAEPGTPGTWRICTGNAAENVCVRIEIVAP